MDGSTMPLTPNSRRSCVSPAFCAEILMPSKMRSNSLGQRIRRRASRTACSGGSSKTRPGAHCDVPRPGASMDTSQTCRPLSYVQGNAGAPFSAQSRRICQRPPPRYPHECGGRCTEENHRFYCSYRRGRRLPLRGRFSARVQTASGHDACPMA